MIVFDQQWCLLLSAKVVIECGTIIFNCFPKISLSDSYISRVVTANALNHGGRLRAIEFNCFDKYVPGQCQKTTSVLGLLCPLAICACIYRKEVLVISGSPKQEPDLGYL